MTMRHVKSTFVCTLLTCDFTLHRQGLNNIVFQRCGCCVAMLDWSQLIVVRVPVLFNKCNVRPCFPPVHIVLPAVLCRSGSSLLKCASASPVTHGEACHVPFDWRLDLLEERGLSLTRFSAPKYVWTEMRTLRENEKAVKKKRRKKKKIMIEWYDRVLGEFWSPVRVVCLFNRTRVLACVCLGVYSFVYCMHSCVKARLWDLSLLCLIWCFPAKPSAPAESDRYTGVVWQGSSAGRTCCTGPQGAFTPWGQTEEHREIHTHTYVFSLQRASMC